jgi:hypothetical protein
MTWTPQEIAKSHGDGCLGPKEEPTLQKWQRLWIRTTESRVIWKGWSRASKMNISTQDDLIALFSENKEKWDAEFQTWNLMPVKKILVPT